MDGDQDQIVPARIAQTDTPPGVAGYLEVEQPVAVGVAVGISRVGVLESLDDDSQIEPDPLVAGQRNLDADS